MFFLQYWIERWFDYSLGATPAFGLEGLRRAQRILKRYGAVGLLVGGTAKDIYGGVLGRGRAKDIDVLVLDDDCKHHPREWEGGVDWFVRHSPEQLHNNGRMDVDYCMRLRNNMSLEPGLYLCPALILEEIDEYLDQELEKIYGGFEVNASGQLFLLPIADPAKLQLTLSLGGPVKNHCKPRKLKAG